MDSGFKYWAFISYSHQDKSWADWLHRALETYRTPRRLLGRPARDGAVPRRLYPVFRDREELPSSADLGDNINAALEASRYLIVICSPMAAVSRWVDGEIRTFKRLGREDRILCLIVGGEPNASDRPDSGQLECFPPALRYRVDSAGGLTQARTEPIAADARAGKDGRANARLKILAGLLGVGYDELKQRERQRRIRRRIQWGAAAAALIALIFGAWLWQAQRQLTENYAEQGRAALLRGDPGAAALFLDEAYRRGLDTPALRQMLGHALAMTVAGHVTLPLPRRSGIGAVSPDGRLVITFVHGKVQAEQSQWQVWDWQHGKPLLEQPRGTGPIQAACFSPDGARFATAGPDGAITVYDSRDGRRLFAVKDRPSRLLAVLFSPDGRALLSISDDPRASLWDAATGKLLETLPGNVLDPRDVRFSRDSRRLLTVTHDGRASVWDTAAKRTVLTLKASHAPIRYAWFSAHERFIVSVDQDGGSEMWTAAGKLIKTAAGGDSRSRNLRIDQDGDHVLVEDEDHGVAVLNVQAADENDATENGALDLFARLPLSSASGQYANDLSSDGRLAATGTLTAAVTLWNVPAGTAIADLTLPHEDNYLYQLVLFPDGRHLAGVGFYGVNQSASRMFVWELPPWPRFMGSGIDGDMGGFSTEADGHLSSVGPDGSAQIWDRHDARLLHSFGKGLGWATWLFESGGKLIAVGRDTGLVQRWDIGSGAQDLSMAPYKTLTAAAFRPDGRRLFLSDGSAGCELALDRAGPCVSLPVPAKVVQAEYTPDGKSLMVLGDRVLLWDSVDGRLRASVATPAHSGKFVAFDISRDGQRLLALYADGTVDRVDLVGGRLLGSMQLPAGGSSWASLQADRQLAAVAVEHKVQIWDLTGPRLKATLDSPATGKMGWFAFSPDGDSLAATDDEEHLGLYDADSGRELFALEGSGNGGPPVFSRDGASVSQGLMGTLAIWDLPLESRPEAEIAAWLRCHVPWRLDKGQLTPATPPPCAPPSAAH